MNGHTRVSLPINMAYLLGIISQQHITLSLSGRENYCLFLGLCVETKGQTEEIEIELMRLRRLINIPYNPILMVRHNYKSKNLNHKLS